MANNPIWPVQPVWNANEVPLSSNPGTLPNVADTVANWFQLLVFEKIVKTVVNFQVVETTTPVQFQGVVITDPKRSLVMNTNGQRMWKVKSLFCWPSVLLAPDDVVKYENVQYRVMAGADYKQYGLFEYWLTQDYTGSGPIGG
jgi:hypothetical protein